MKILRPSYLHNGISYTGKMTFLYRIRALEGEAVFVGDLTNSQLESVYEESLETVFRNSMI